jgi:hypothetical protein
MTVPTREQVRALLDERLDYSVAGQRLGIPAGLAYLIATGRPADGGDTPSQREVAAGGLLASSQHLSNPPHENPTASKAVQEWIRARVAADAPMREAAERRKAEPGAPPTPASKRAPTRPPPQNPRKPAAPEGKPAAPEGKPANHAQNNNVGA